MNSYGFKKPDPSKTKVQSAGAYIIMAMIAFAFSVIVIKEVQLPKAVLVAGALVAGAVLFIKGMSQPEIVTYVLVAYMPFSKVLVGDFGGFSQALNVTNFLVGFILIAWFSGRYAKGESLWTGSPLNGLIGLFIGMALVALFRGSYYETGYLWLAFIEFKRWVTPVFLFFLVLNTVKERWMIKNVVITIIIVCTLVGLMAIYEYINIGDVGDLENARVGGISEHSNSLAAFFSYYIFLPFGFFLMNRKKPMYWLLLLPFLIQFRGIMVTFSRGGYLAFAAGFGAISFFRSKGTLLAMIIGVFILFQFPQFLPGGIRYRMAQTIEKKTSTYADVSENLEGSLEASSAIRIKIWKAAIEMIKDNPVFGVGYGLFDLMLPRYLPGVQMDAHNTYLILAAEMGIPTLLVFLIIVMVAGIQALMLYYQTKDPFSKAFALGMLGGIAGLLMSNMFGSRLDSQEVSSYFWILCALLVRLRILDKQDALKAKTQPVISTDDSSQPEKPKLSWFERPGTF
jgi:putative inorganic carbon (hco3(-)) transporter